MYDRTIRFSNFHPSQISKIQSIALPETTVSVESFTSSFSAIRDSQAHHVKSGRRLLGGSSKKDGEDHFGVAGRSSTTGNAMPV
jgi:hypothetical protein